MHLMKLSYGTDEGQDAYQIATPHGTWHYQPDAGGFSSIVDSDGRDWIGFARGPAESPRGAANVFRGLPNMVHPDDIGHPGHRKCQSDVIDNGNPAMIVTKSLDYEWEWNVVLSDEVTVLDSVRAPRPYWFLYEGVPAGRFAPSETVWATDTGEFAGRTGLDRYPGRPEEIGPTRWIGFRAAAERRWLCLARINPTQTAERAEEDRNTLFFMESGRESSPDAPDAGGMVVFGFGRTPALDSLLTGHQSFCVCLIDAATPAELAGTIAERLDASANLLGHR
jgi:hypothetical protein